MRRLLEKLLMITIVLAVMTMIVGALIPMVETTDARSNIDTLFDGIWWAVSTITSVGYGDHYPITTAGRILGFCLILFGSSTFFVFTSLVAAALLLRETEKDHNEIMAKLRELEEKVDKLSKK